MNRSQKDMRPNKAKLTPFQKLEHELRESAELENEDSSLNRSARAGEKRTANNGKTKGARMVTPAGASALSDGVSDDDLAPETLIHEDGANSPYEAGSDVPADQTFSVVNGDEIGAGYGLDEAELGRVKPLDGKPWRMEGNRTEH